MSEEKRLREKAAKLSQKLYKRMRKANKTRSKLENTQKAIFRLGVTS